MLNSARLPVIALYSRSALWLGIKKKMKDLRDRIMTKVRIRRRKHRKVYDGFDYSFYFPNQ